MVAGRKAKRRHGEGRTGPASSVHDQRKAAASEAEPPAIATAARATPAKTGPRAKRPRTGDGLSGEPSGGASGGASGGTEGGAAGPSSRRPRSTPATSSAAPSSPRPRDARGRGAPLSPLDSNAAEPELGRRKRHRHSHTQMDGGARLSLAPQGGNALFAANLHANLQYHLSKSARTHYISIQLLTGSKGGASDLPGAL